jgi:hypothetical protein
MPNMTEPTPRPCHHTTFAVVAVLLAGFMLGAFSPPASDGGKQVVHAVTKVATDR